MLVQVLVTLIMRSVLEAEVVAVSVFVSLDKYLILPQHYSIRVQNLLAVYLWPT